MPFNIIKIEGEREGEREGKGEGEGEKAREDEKKQNLLLAKLFFMIS